MEVNEVTEHLKNNKCPGRNGITNENIEYAQEYLKEEIYYLIIDIWRNAKMLKKWNNLMVIPMVIKKETHITYVVVAEFCCWIQYTKFWQY